MDKTIPRAAIEEEVLRTSDCNLLRFLCPNCKHLVESVYDYCGFCGQAIKIDKE